MQIEGVITEDPEMGFTPMGKAVTTFRVLVDESSPKKIVAWEELAEKCSEHLRKGLRVRLFGSEKERWWTNSDGEKRSQLEFTINRVQVLKNGT